MGVELKGIGRIRRSKGRRSTSRAFRRESIKNTELDCTESQRDNKRNKALTQGALGEGGEKCKEGKRAQDRVGKPTTRKATHRSEGGLRKREMTRRRANKC